MNPNTYFFIFIVFISILICFYFLNKTESFLNQTNLNSKKTIILMGDSMLANNSFVKKGFAIDDYLTNKLSSSQIFMLAQNGSTITSVYNQLNKIPLDLNNSNTYLFLSVGGNNILSNQWTIETINNLFENYKILVDSILTRFPYANIYLLSLYYPHNNEFKQYYSLIDLWNTKLTTIVPHNHIIFTNNIIQNKTDLVYHIEPSAIGGKKISNAILSKIYS